MLFFVGSVDFSFLDRIYGCQMKKLTAYKRHRRDAYEARRIYNMKTVIAKLTQTMIRMKKSIAHMFAEYERSINELGGTAAYDYLFEPCVMM